MDRLINMFTALLNLMKIFTLKHQSWVGFPLVSQDRGWKTSRKCKARKKKQLHGNHLLFCLRCGTWDLETASLRSCQPQFHLNKKQNSMSFLYGQLLSLEFFVVPFSPAGSQKTLSWPGINLFIHLFIHSFNKRLFKCGNYSKEELICLCSNMNPTTYINKT